MQPPSTKATTELSHIQSADQLTKYMSLLSTATTDSRACFQSCHQCVLLRCYKLNRNATTAVQRPSQSIHSCTAADLTTATAAAVIVVVAVVIQQHALSDKLPLVDHDLTDALQCLPAYICIRVLNQVHHYLLSSQVPVGSSTRTSTVFICSSSTQ
jgi:hypothetical protein